MRKILFSMLFTVIIAGTAFAQKKIIEGTIIYTVEWKLPEQAKQMAANMPKELTVYFKGDSSSLKTESQMFNSKVIMNEKASYQRLLLDIPIMSKKYSVILTPADQEMMKESWPDFVFAAGIETKSILGYKTQKVMVKDKKSGTEYEAWFSKEVDIAINPLTHLMDQSYGFPLEFTTYVNSVPVKAVVKEIRTTAIPVDSFRVGKDYEEIAFEQLNALSGKR